MLIWCIWWIVFGLITWVMEIAFLAQITCSRFDLDRDVCHKIGSEWMDDHFCSMIPVFMAKSPIFGNLWTFLCTFVAWPFDRIAMYIHWKETCKRFNVKKKGS